ncbi:MAG: hypothetical protein FH753_07065 [Firmicutes bacterium]|nr:hypothetical protein [Bacillota bacterium]
MKDVDNYIVDELMTLKLNKEKIVSIHQNQDNNASPPVNISILKDKKKNIEKQITKLIDLYQYEHIPAKELSQRIESLYKDKEKLQKTIERNSQPKKNNSDIKLNEILEYVDKIDLIWEEATFEERRIILKDFIKKIYVKNNNDIDIVWNPIN